jgi:RHS repeat-associated protein
MGVMVAGMDSAHGFQSVTYYYTDHLDTVLATTDANGLILSQADYRPFGVRVVGAPERGIGFAGHVDEPENGLSYMQQRYYDPTSGRFLTADPVEAQPGDAEHFGRFTYAYNNPVTHRDPDGRCPVCIVVFVSLFTMSDYANAPGVDGKTYHLTTADRAQMVTGALPGPRIFTTGRSIFNVVRSADRMSQRAATREAKRQAGIPTSQQASSQTNGKVDGTNVGRQQTYDVAKEGGGTEQKSVQISRDVEGDHAGMPQVEAGTLKDPLRFDPAGRPRIQNDGKVRVDYDPGRKDL